MASYNHADFIGQAIESIQKQDYDAWELLIADDASSDHTLDVLRAYTGDQRIRILPFANNREYHMRNAAAKQARGKYIAFLNSDDLYYPGKLRKQVERLEQSPAAAAVFTHVHCINEKGERLNNHPLETILSPDNQSSHQWLNHFFFSGNRLCISSAMIRRDHFMQAGTFNPLLIQIGDLDLWIKLCLSHNDISIIPEPLTAMRMLDTNLSNLSPASKSRLILEEQEVYARYFSLSAIEQFPEIFPEFMTALPEDSLPWRQYLLCRAAIGMPRKTMKLLGYKKLHTLLSDQTTRQCLQQKNPRLLRTLFFSEGTAGLCDDYPQTEWSIAFSVSNHPEQRTSLLSYWTDNTPNGTVCLSFTNPNSPATLHLSLAGASSCFECRQFRLYDELTGQLIFTARAGHPSYTSNGLPCYQFSEIDFSVIASQWIDCEIERAPISLKHKTRRILNRLYRKLLKKIIPGRK